MNDQRIIQNQPGLEENQDATPPFKVSKEGINFLIQKYLNRKNWEDVDYLQQLRGPKFYEAGLCTSFQKGLNEESEEAKNIRISVFDTNERPPEEPIRFCDFVLEALADKIIIILIFAAIIQTIIGVFFGHNPKIDWIDGMGIISAVIVVTLVGSINNYNKETEFRRLKLQDQQERFVLVRRNGEWKTISEEALLVGDIMKIESGNTIPCDCLLVEGSAEMDESAMTGEIDPIAKATLESCIDKAAEVKAKREKRKAEKKAIVLATAHHDVESPIILSGTQVNSGDGSALILTVGNNSENGKIRATIESNKSSGEGTPLEQKLNDLADKIGWCGLVSAIITAIGMGINLGVRLGLGIMEWDNTSYMSILKIFIIGVTVVVVAIPEGLPLAVTMTLAFSIGKMLQENNFVRRMESCETMGNAEFVCTDKTGTLTKNEMQVTKYYNFSQEEYDLNETVSDSWRGNPLRTFHSKEEWEIFKISLACNTNTVFDETGRDKGNKSDESLTKLLKKFGADVKQIREDLIKNINGNRPQINFTSKRKRMSTVITNEDLPTGHRILLKGASELVIKSCTHYLKPDGTKEPINSEINGQIQGKIKAYADETLRTFSIAYRDITKEEAENWNEDSEDSKGNKIKPIEESNFVLIGIIAIKDHMKEGVTKAIEDCTRARIRVIMITGDNIDTAVAIAKGCKIATSRNQAILGDAFMEKIGGLICANCNLKDSVGKGGDDRFSCKCPRTKEEWVLKWKQNKRKELIKENQELYNHNMRSKEAKDEFEAKLDEEAFEEFRDQKIKCKQDAIANIEAFREVVKDLRVIARSQPQHKYALITGLRQMDHVVAVTGDGTNDAPALSKADVGFAMDAGTDIAKEASDIVIKDNQFSSIVKAIKWGRNVFDNIRRFLQFQLSVNVCACILVMVGASVGQESPLTPIQMLWVNMIMDSLGSVALASEKPTDALLDRPPNRRSDFIINRKMFKHIFGQSIFQLIILFIILFTGHQWIKEYRSDFAEQAFLMKSCFGADAPIYYDTELNVSNMYVISGMETWFSSGKNIEFPAEIANICNENFEGVQNLKGAYLNFKSDYYSTTHYTILFNTFVLCQLCNELCCRVIDDGYNIFVRINTNILFLFVIIIEIVMQVLIIAYTGPVFKVSKGGLATEHWVICIVFSLLTFPVNFILKLLPDPCSKDEDLGFGNEKGMLEESLIGSIRGGSFAKRASLMVREGSKAM